MKKRSFNYVIKSLIFKSNIYKTVANRNENETFFLLLFVEEEKKPKNLSVSKRIEVRFTNELTYWRVFCIEFDRFSFEHRSIWSYRRPNLSTIVRRFVASENENHFQKSFLNERKAMSFSSLIDRSIVWRTVVIRIEKFQCWENLLSLSRQILLFCCANNL